MSRTRTRTPARRACARPRDRPPHLARWPQPRRQRPRIPRPRRCSCRGSGAQSLLRTKDQPTARRTMNLPFRSRSLRPLPSRQLARLGCPSRRTWSLPSKSSTPLQASKRARVKESHLRTRPPRCQSRASRRTTSPALAQRLPRARPRNLVGDAVAGYVTLYLISSHSVCLPFLAVGTIRRTPFGTSAPAPVYATVRCVRSTAFIQRLTPLPLPPVSSQPRLLWRSEIDSDSLDVLQQYHARAVGQPLPKLESTSTPAAVGQWSRKMERAGL